jgi:phospholipid/cholesterol/gamma-HCH transport system substrate-binding protein
MNERVMQFRVGVVVLATAIITAILVLLIDGFPTFGEGRYTVYVFFKQAPGVTAGTPVRKSGILIGRVAKVEFAEDIGLDPSLGVRVTCEIDNNRKIYSNEVPRIEKSILGGDYAIEFTRPAGLPSAEGTAASPPGAAGPPGPAGQPGPKNPAELEAQLGPQVKPGEAIQGQIPGDPLQVIANLEGDLSVAINSIARTSDSVAKTSQNIGDLAQRVNKLIADNGQQFSNVINKAQTALDQIQSTATNLNAIVGDPMMRENIQKVAKDLPRVTLEMTEALATMRQTLQSADRNLTNIEGLTKPLGERGGQLVANIDRATATLDTVFRDLSAVTRAINSSEGTVGRLLNDPQLYQELSAATKNINELTRELKPIIRDARVFSDSLARHPEKLGVRGALFPSSGLKN